MKRNLLALSIGFLLFIIFVMLLFTYQVRKSEVAVVTRFGKVNETATNGFHGKWPWPIEKVYKFDQRIQNFEDKYDESLTADSYNLLTMVYVGWKIDDPQTFFPKFASGSIPAAEKTMEGLVRSAKNAVIGQHPLSDFVSTDEKQLKFVEVENEILKIVQDQVNARNYGIRMEYLGFKKLGFPESVTQEVFKRMTSERQVLASKTQFEGESEANRIRSAAESKSAEILANADAEATRIKAEGQAEAVKSYAVFQENPEFAIFVLDIEAMDMLTNRTTMILDRQTPPLNLLQGGYTTNLTHQTHQH